MERSLWIHYKEEEINDKIVYWVDFWEDLTVKLFSESIGFKIVSPTSLLRDIKDEIKYNKLRNKSNINYFKEQLGFFLENDLVIKKRFSSDFKLLLKEFNHGRLNYFIRLCEGVETQLKNEGYFKKSWEELKKILLSSEWKANDKENIQQISKNLIVEFILAGYSLEAINRLPVKIFSPYQEQGNIIITDYPHKTHYKKFMKQNKFDESSFYAAIKEEMKGLTLSKRLNRFTHFYTLKARQAHFIFQVEGMKGSVDYKINTIHFYSVDKKRYIKRPLGRTPEEKNKYENFGKELSDPYINAAVIINYVDSKHAAETAITRINEALDVIRCHVKSKLPLRVVQNKYRIIDKQGRDLGGSSSADPDTGFFKRHYSFNLNQIFKDKHEKLFIKKLNKKLAGSGDFKKKLTYALHWYKKGFESDKNEDKLLNYWIAIESLLTIENLEKNVILKKSKQKKKRVKKIDLILDLLPSFEINDWVYRVARNLFYELDSLAKTKQGLPYTPMLTISIETLKKYKLGLQTGGKVNLQDFVNNLPDLEREEEKILIKDKIEFVRKFYSNNAFVKTELNKKIKSIRDDLLSIYRIRNLIMHDAHYDMMTIPYFVMKAESYANGLIRFLLNDYVLDDYNDAVEAIFSRKVKLDRLLNKLENNEFIDVWKY